MMLYPSMSTLLSKINSRYLLVNVVARRSRDISEDAIDRGEPLRKKAVSLAIDEVAEGKCGVVTNREYD
ncbi:MAG: DNA-directed RNA polymerase subunit omega [Oscillospiraceae bacterium]|jgi:DNA-directed RNA polymerase omega subunit|nr:DNA-directed RNA polymerase subunit omega [Oscillospiraceae bacterium]